MKEVVFLRIRLHSYHIHLTVLQYYTCMQYTVIHKIHTYTKMNLSTVKWAQWYKTQSRELLGLFIMCALHCAQFLRTILHRTDLIIFHVTLQTMQRWCLFEGGGFTNWICASQNNPVAPRYTIPNSRRSVRQYWVNSTRQHWIIQDECDCCDCTVVFVQKLFDGKLHVHYFRVYYYIYSAALTQGNRI